MDHTGKLNICNLELEEDYTLDFEGSKCVPLVVDAQVASQCSEHFDEGHKIVDQCNEFDQDPKQYDAAPFLPKTTPENVD